MFIAVCTPLQLNKILSFWFARVFFGGGGVMWHFDEFKSLRRNFWSIYESKYSNCSKYIAIFIDILYNTPLKSVFSVLKHQKKNPKNWFCQKMQNFSKSRQKVPVKLVYIAEDILVTLTLKKKLYRVSNEMHHPVPSLLNLTQWL